MGQRVDQNVKIIRENKDSDTVFRQLLKLFSINQHNPISTENVILDNSVDVIFVIIT